MPISARIPARFPGAALSTALPPARSRVTSRLLAAPLASRRTRSSSAPSKVASTTSRSPSEISVSPGRVDPAAGPAVDPDVASRAAGTRRMNEQSSPSPSRTVPQR